MNIVKTVKQIDSFDFDRLVIKTYGKPYCFQQQEGCKPRGVEIVSTDEEYLYDFENDSIPEVINGEEMGVSFKAWLERDPNVPLNPTDEELKNCPYFWGEDREKWKKEKSHIDMFWQRNFYPQPNMVLKDLCEKGLLEPGKYQILIDW